MVRLVFRPSEGEERRRFVKARVDWLTLSGRPETRYQRKGFREGPEAETAGTNTQDGGVTVDSGFVKYVTKE